MKIPDHSIQTQFRCVRRHFKGRYMRAVGPVEVIALLNVLFLLFMFHMLGSAYILQPGVRVSLPTAPFQDGVPYGAMIFTITQEGMLFFNDERIDWNAVAPRLQKAVRDGRESTLLIEADEQTPYRSLLQIYTEAKAVGISEVALAVRPPPAVKP